MSTTANIEGIYTPRWPDGLEQLVGYRFHCDDEGRDGQHWLQVFVGQDGDAYVSMQARSEDGFMNPIPGIRCRTSIGGGRHLRTRQALLNLADAIRLDNEELKRPAAG